MICNVLRGPYEGKIYPEAYSDEEFKAARSCHSHTPYMWDYQSHEQSPFNKRCVSGRWGFQVDFDGTVYNCPYSRQKLGNIFDESLMVYDENCHCTSTVCESQCVLSMLGEITENYRMNSDSHTFVKRDKKGYHPLL